MNSNAKLRQWLWLVWLMQALWAGPLQAADALPSWNEGATKQSIVAFVERVTKHGSPEFVAPAARIAVFDNDGTLWSEQPMYFQFLFTFDRVRALAPQHPEWQDQPVIKALLAGDMKGVMASGERGIFELVAAAQTGTSTEDFSVAVNDWIATARHPKSKRRYAEMVYQPMLELLAYLRANGFKTYICSGGSIDFMRAWAEYAYGIPPEQVIGSSFKYGIESSNGTPTIVLQPELDVSNDKAVKPVSIYRIIGRRPLLTFGNSDGDLAMLQWTAAGDGARLMGIVHHTDAEREVAYDRTSFIGKLDKALDEATSKGWTIVDMKRDWKQVFPPERKPLAR